MLLINGAAALKFEFWDRWHAAAARSVVCIACILPRRDRLNSHDGRLFCRDYPAEGAHDSVASGHAQLYDC